MLDLIQRLGGPPPRAEAPPPYLVVDATDDPRRVAAHRAMRRRAFVLEQGLFDHDDLDACDEHPRCRVLVVIDRDGRVRGGVRLHPAHPDADLGWWRGSRLVADSVDGVSRGRVGAALVAAACARVLDEGALRFDAHVQAGQAGFFTRLGWEQGRELTVAGAPHVLMRWPIDRISALAQATKAPLAGLLGGLLPEGRWLGDDGVPVGQSGSVLCTDAILPSMVEADPEWAGWCGMLVTAHDLCAMGAQPVGALDALGTGSRAAAERVLTGLRRGAEAFDLPLLGGHLQLGVPGALSVTGVGHTNEPVPAGGGLVGDELQVTADLGGGWRPGYRGRQWDSSSQRSRGELRAMLDSVARARPHAAKDVSMAGLAGTAGMLAEASGCGAELEVARIPRPGGVSSGDWLTCFPGFGVVTADRPGAVGLSAGPAVGAACGGLVAEPGVRLRWPDGEITNALTGTVCGLGSTQRAR